MDPNTPNIPSPIEAACYYYGLPSRPTLVARSSVDLWVEPTGPEAYLQPKELHPVGPHHLDHVWEPTVASAIEVYLGSQQIEWTSVDPVRIGYADGDTFPVIIWVGVVPGSLAAEKGLQVALGCRMILAENGISDVHVEIRESDVFLHAKLYKPAISSNPTAQAIEPFTTSLGLPICSGDTTNSEGTGGFFFIDSNRPGKLFLVTARHVLFHPDTSNEPYETRFGSQAAKKVFLLSDSGLQKRIETIQTEIRRKDILATHAAARLQAAQDLDDEDAKYERADALRMKEDANEAIAALNKLLRDRIPNWMSPADRIIGHVVLSPRLGFSVGPNKHTEDWAVIEIDRSRVDKTNFVANCVDLGASTPVDKFHKWMCTHPGSPTSFEYPGDRLLKFSGTIPDTPIDSSDSGTLDPGEDPVIMVIKRGGASGLTVGRLNSIRSIVRFSFKGKLCLSTRELAVYPRNFESGAFSEPGDSGSVVIDGRGRVAGIITGGAGPTSQDKSSDCTYVRSINFLIERLKENGYEPNIFPTAADL
ncbi:hypothetical protein C2E23DRAFT_387013 [Lenzites betulinus]|nr:hypothetical protein C2E23DRAFT_387013 [Lenzites betulinus]